MLVLLREVSGTIVITAPDGTRITIMRIEVRGDKCSVGVAAPREWAVHRGEIQDRMDHERKGED